MATGEAITNRFPIGVAEVRIAPMTSALKLTAAHSLGVVDNASVAGEVSKVELPAGFPQRNVASVVTANNLTLTATAREYSYRNMRLTVGEGITTSPTDVSSQVTTSLAVAGVSFDVSSGDGANFSAGKHVVIYNEALPEIVHYGIIESIATDTITLTAETAAAVALDGTADTIRIFEANSIALGATTQTHYFSCSVLQKEQSTGRPLIFNFWKASSSGSFTYETSATDFASNNMEFEILQPSRSDYFESGSDLFHIKSLIATYPVGMYTGGADT